MCNSDCINFVIDELLLEYVLDSEILEVGSYNVNGSVSFKLKERNPKKYIGVDISNGPCVDQICNVIDLVTTFGSESFDHVISTEMLEHVEDWRSAINNMKGVCKVGGHILITTRSFGFPLHGYPKDYWRFEISDMEQIFQDCQIVNIRSDMRDIGVFVHVIKQNTVACDLSNIQLYSMLTQKRQ